MHECMQSHQLRTGRRMPAFDHTGAPVTHHQAQPHTGLQGLMYLYVLPHSENSNPVRRQTPIYWSCTSHQPTIMMIAPQIHYVYQALSLSVHIIIIIRICPSPRCQLVWTSSQEPGSGWAVRDALKARSPKGWGGRPWKESRETPYLILQSVCCMSFPQNSRTKKS